MADEGVLLDADIRERLACRSTRTKARNLSQRN